MISCIFTLDYELYGNGEGSLADLVYQPTEILAQVFEAAGVPFVCFVETAELVRIGKQCSDDSIANVRRQISRLYQDGNEIALHIHPQWFNASYQDGHWCLDYSEYNICTLSSERIAQIVHQGISYLRYLLSNPDFTPVSFRAGNWLLQPSKHVASVLAKAGIKLDSSVFKGGLQRKHGLDYRLASKNGPFWSFTDDVNKPETNGALLELPIYTEMVPFWKMLTEKRLRLQSKGCNAGKGGWRRFARIRDFMRLRHPLKFDFCRMTLRELIAMTDRAIQADREHPNVYTPIVAIGHSKDLVDYQTIESYLAYLDSKGIVVSTLEDVYRRCAGETSDAAAK